MANSYTREELKRLQAMPLSEKITLSKLRIVEWYEHFSGQVYVSYSGGKDSTILLDMVRSLYPETPAVYVDTRLDFPEVREQVKATEKVIWLKPEKIFREVIDTYGFCYPSKEIAQHIESARRGVPYAIKLFEGFSLNGKPKRFAKDHKRWKRLIDLPVKISPKCCAVMKERPLEKYQRESGLRPYVGIMAAESLRRRQSWYRTGCNAFKAQKSKPISFWTEQDVLRYIVDHNIKIPSVYGNIVADKNGKFYTTGERRTGCIFCPIGAHLDKENKFQRMKETHPELYKYCMEQLGLDEFLTLVGVAH